MLVWYDWGAPLATPTPGLRPKKARGDDCLPTCGGTSRAAGHPRPWAEPTAGRSPAKFQLPLRGRRSLLSTNIRFFGPRDAGMAPNP